MIEGRALAESIEGLSNGVELELRGLGVPEERLQELLMAVDEAITNIVMYGYDGERGDIRISTRLENDCVAVEIVDGGREFDPTKHPAPKLDVPLEERQIGGMGVQLMRRMTDGMEYHRKDGFNHFILRKRTGQADG